MINYVVGLLFNNDFTKIVLLEKNRPKTLNGLLNGVGGHIEADESGYRAMIREFKEETGLVTEDRLWNLFLELGGWNWSEPREAFNITWFAGMAENHVLDTVKTTTDEAVAVYSVDAILNKNTYKVVPNLKWIIPMAINHLKREDKCIYYNVSEAAWRIND